MPTQSATRRSDANGLPEEKYGAFSITVIRDDEGLEKFRQLWEAWEWHPNADFDFYRLILSCRAEIIRPHIILVSSPRGPEALLIGRIEEASVDFRIGYRTLFTQKARLLAVIYGGMLGGQSPGALEALVDQLMRDLKDREADAVFLHHLSTESTICRLARERAPFACRDHIPLPILHYQLTLPRSFDHFQKSMKQKHRYWVRRVERLFEKDHPEGVSVEYIRYAHEVDHLCEIVEEVAGKTYQRALGVGFINNDENRRRLQLEAKKGWLRAYVLRAGDRTSAFWIGSLFGDTFHLGWTGYDPDDRKYEPGTILFMKLIDDLCREGIKLIDFGFGDAFYKQRFGNVSWSEASVFMFAPTFKGLRMNMIRTVNAGMTRTAEFLIEKGKLKERVKKYWRNYLRIRRRTSDGRKER